MLRLPDPHQNAKDVVSNTEDDYSRENRNLQQSGSNKTSYSSDLAEDVDFQWSEHLQPVP